MKGNEISFWSSVQVGEEKGFSQVRSGGLVLDSAVPNHIIQICILSEHSGLSLITLSYRQDHIYSAKTIPYIQKIKYIRV